MGLADPRGCEYRVVEINGFGEIHGWVLPDDDGGPRYVIGFDGLLYVAASVGSRADLRADMAEPSTPLLELFLVPKLLDYHQVHPIMVAMLLRVGEGELAAQRWAAYEPTAIATTATPQGPFELFYWSFLFGASFLAQRNFADGDDQLALRHASMVKAALPLLTPKTHERNLLEDFESIQAHNDSLLQRLETTKQASTVSVTDDNPEQLLVAQGDAAVPTLLECLERDCGLSRYYRIVLSPIPYFEFRPVRRLALDLLIRLLDLPWHDVPIRTWRDLGTDGPARIRAHFGATRGRPPWAFWYSLFADWSTPPDDVVHAARLITTREASGDLRGEPLRGLRWPTVTNLFEDRIAQWVDSFGEFPCALAHAFHTWDPAVADPVLEREATLFMARGGESACVREFVSED
ncbi:MAG: hypothetical protein U0271_34070 [Polyangiaceae bacterium]